MFVSVTHLEPRCSLASHLHSVSHVPHFGRICSLAWIQELPLQGFLSFSSAFRCSDLHGGRSSCGARACCCQGNRSLCFQQDSSLGILWSSPTLPKVAGMPPASIPYPPAVQEGSTERTWMQAGTAAAYPMPTPSLPREGMQGSQAAGPVQTFSQTTERQISSKMAGKSTLNFRIICIVLAKFF